jgi:hypothetical protein
LRPATIANRWQQGKHLEMERDPATQEVGQGGEQRSKYRFNTGNAAWAPTEKSTKSTSMEFLLGTGSANFVRSFSAALEKSLHEANLS